MAGDDDEILETGTKGEVAEGQNAGAGDDEAEVSAEQPDLEADDGEPEVAVDADAKPSRGEARFQRLANETKAAREDAAVARREAEDLRRQQWTQQSQQTEQQQREMLALMTPDERTEYRINQFRTEQTQQRQQDQHRIASLLDKTAFDAKATVNPVYARHKDAVEERFQEQLRQGRPVEREILLKLHLGELALQGAGKAGAARRQAAGRVQSQKVSAGSGKGDAATERGRAGDTPASRLKDVYI